MFTDPTLALVTTKQYAGIDQTDPTYDTTLVAILEASKSPTSYRIFITAAMHLYMVSASARGQLKSADGATWLTPKELAESLNGLLTTQEAFDAALTDIPKGWAVADKRSQLCGCQTMTTINSELPLFSAIIA